MTDELSAEQQAAQVVEQARQRRVANCEKAIQDALRAYRCALDVSVTLRAGQVLPEVRIIAQD